MGNKVAAIEAMQAADVPTVPGSNGPLADDDAKNLQIAKDIGFPVIVKATAGGGGRGMRVVHTESNLLSSIQITKAEAKAAFGDETVYLEKFLEKPRHVEVQVLADQQGNAVTFTIAIVHCNVGIKKYWKKHQRLKSTQKRAHRF